MGFTIGGHSVGTSLSFGNGCAALARGSRRESHQKIPVGPSDNSRTGFSAIRDRYRMLASRLFQRWRQHNH